MSRKRLRPDVVNGSVRGCERGRDASRLLGKQDAVIICVRGTSGKCPVQSDFRNSRSCRIHGDIPEITQVQRGLIGNGIFAGAIQWRESIVGLGSDSGRRFGFGIAARKEIVEIVVHRIAVVHKEPDGAGGRDIVITNN